MIQDIAPHQLHNEFIDKNQPAPQDMIMCFDHMNLLVTGEDREISYPVYQDLLDAKLGDHLSYQFLFTLDETDVYLLKTDAPVSLKGFRYETTQIFRKMDRMELAYVGTTACHLYQWYQNNQFCGRCGHKMIHDHKERMVSCPDCHNLVYPRISPSVIVGVLNQDKILVTKYAGSRGYKRYALVAGFTEIGETVEETVAREVLEETGVRVKNITYYKSQPWGFTGGLLLGYWAELDGDDQITLDTEELAEGKWVTASEIELDCSTVSLTREMMNEFREGRISGDRL